VKNSQDNMKFTKYVKRRLNLSENWEAPE
jgi:hypothetical protein